jgi:hypothetical protein
MINPKAPKEVLLSILAAASISVWASSSPAQDAISSKAATLTADNTTTTESRGPSPEDLGTGNFWRFPFKVTIDVGGGYDDNVSTSSFLKQGSWFTNGNVAISYDFGSPRTKLSLGIGAGVTYYWEQIHDVTGLNTTDYDINSSIKFSLTHKANPRLTLSTDDYLTYQTEPDFSIAQGLNRRGGNFFFTQDKATVAYLWTPRFSTATSYTLGALHYDNHAVGVFENRFENTFGNEFRFLIQPTTSLVVEYRFEVVSYESADRDSTTHFALGGFDYAFNPRLTSSLRAGAQFREYSQGPNHSSPYFEGTLGYAVGKQTTVEWTNRYSIEESDVALSQGRETFRTGLSARHNFTARISGSLGAYYEHDDYQSLDVAGVAIPGFIEESFDCAVTLRYAINRYWGVQAGYNHTEVSSDVALRDYSRNRYWGGLNVSF